MLVFKSHFDFRELIVLVEVEVERFTLIQIHGSRCYRLRCYILIQLQYQVHKTEFVILSPVINSVFSTTCPR